jgi:hypothetical protein
MALLLAIFPTDKRGSLGLEGRKQRERRKTRKAKKKQVAAEGNQRLTEVKES